MRFFIQSYRLMNTIRLWTKHSSPNYLHRRKKTRMHARKMNHPATNETLETNSTVELKTNKNITELSIQFDAAIRLCETFKVQFLSSAHF